MSKNKTWLASQKQWGDLLQRCLISTVFKIADLLKLAHGASRHFLIKEVFCSFLHALLPFLQEGRWCYVCAYFSNAEHPPPSRLHSDPPLMLCWRSIVFVLYVNVYQRVPTVNTSTYKVMYWHRRVRGDPAGSFAHRGCAAEREGLGGGGTRHHTCGRRTWD